VIVDADVHAVIPSIETLFPYLTAPWIEYVEQSGFKGPVDTPYPKAPTSARPGSGTSLQHLREQALDPLKVDHAIVNCSYAVESIHNPDTDIALARAVNDWLVAEWLDKEPRLRASIIVPSKQPAAAAREIDRVAADRRFVQLYLPVRSYLPYGKRHFHPIFEAAVRHDLVVGLHFGGAPGNPPTSVGWPSYYLEEYAGMAQAFQSQLQSMVVEGLFDRFPALRVTCVEGGFAWLPPFLWRLDKEWKGLQREVPWTKRLPSEYVREHVRFTIQPADLPPDPARLGRLVEQVGGEEVLLFASDYPHVHDDPPVQLLTPKIMGSNAAAFYGRIG